MSLPLNRKHELSVMNIFMNRMQKAADAEGKRFVGAPLDGQDAWLGADCLISEGSHFAMAEFKYEAPDIRSESKKPRRLAMCKALLGANIWLRDHKACHLIAWSARDDNRTVILNCYSDEVCNAQIWGAHHDLKDMAETGARRTDEVFVEEFLSSKIGLEFAAFEAYIEWLSQFDGCGSNSIELLIENPDKNVFGALQFASLGELKQWMDNNPPRPKPRGPSARSDSGGSFSP